MCLCVYVYVSSAWEEAGQDVLEMGGDAWVHEILGLLLVVKWDLEFFAVIIFCGCLQTCTTCSFLTAVWHRLPEMHSTGGDRRVLLPFYFVPPPISTRVLPCQMWSFNAKKKSPHIFIITPPISTPSLLYNQHLKHLFFQILNLGNL